VAAPGVAAAIHGVVVAPGVAAAIHGVVVAPGVAAVIRGVVAAMDSGRSVGNLYRLQFLQATDLS
jgi:hypothetical protein